MNNLDWFGPMSFLGFLRDVGKYARVGAMLAKDSVGLGWRLGAVGWGRLVHGWGRRCTVANRAAWLVAKYT
jgi:hypothetical protein